MTFKGEKGMGDFRKNILHDDFEGRGGGGEVGSPWNSWWGCDTRLQNKMGKVYTHFQTKTAQKPNPMGWHIPI